MSEKLSILLISQLVFKTRSEDYSELEWELLLSQARASGLLSRLAFFRKNFGLFESPCFVDCHLESAEKYWFSQKRIVNWELYCLQQTFDQLKIPLILLKGAAYSASNLNAGLGRVFNDIDILVPKNRLQEVKEKLKWGGWFPEKMDDYDRRYYEEWMHELPPIRHIKRGTTLDVHHNILPLTNFLCPEAKHLLDAAIRIPDSHYWTLSAEDMVLHSACHLFFGGEFENGLRDLSDIDLLLREFSNKDSFFWEKLLERAKQLNLIRPLFYALRYSVRLLKTPVPETIIEESFVQSSIGKYVQFMDLLFLPALLPNHPSCNSIFTNLARWLLYVRSHWLKMPWYLLFSHLVRKAFMRVTGKGQH